MLSCTPSSEMDVRGRGRESMGFRSHHLRLNPSLPGHQLFQLGIYVCKMGLRGVSPRIFIKVRAECDLANVSPDQCPAPYKCLVKGKVFGL